MPSETQNGIDRSFKPRIDWLAGLVCLCAGMTLFARHFWVAEIIANLRIQLILGLLGTLAILLLLRRWRMVFVVTAVTIWQTTWLIPAFQASPGSKQLPEQVNAAAPAEHSQQLCVFLANVLTRNRQHGHIAAQIKQANPDVIVILELSSELKAALNREFGDSYKYAVFESRDDGNFGIGLWSRSPVTNAGIFHLNSQWLPSIEADVEFDSRRIRVFATHTIPPMGSRNFAQRNQHLALLAKRIQKQQSDEPLRPTLLLGDLNLTPWSPFFRDFCESSELENAAAGYGLQPTWYAGSALNAGGSFPFGLILDHALCSKDLSCDNRQILPANGSDHRALVYRFSANSTR